MAVLSSKHSCKFSACSNSNSSALRSLRRGNSAAICDWLPSQTSLPSWWLILTPRLAVRALEATEKAAAILRRGGASAYDRALKALLPDSRDWWHEHVEEGEGEYESNADGWPHLSTTICYRPASVARRKFVTWRQSRRKRWGRVSSPSV